MNKQDVPVYIDPEIMGDKYPCDTQYMVYEPMVHKYFLTEEALNYYGLDVERKYISSANNKTREFIEKVTKKIYDYIRYKVGSANYQVILYRIATSNNGLNVDKYAFRKEFEGVLVAEAKWLLENGDAAQYSGENKQLGTKPGIKPEEQWMNEDDIAIESKRALLGMELTKWFTLAPNRILDTNKF